MLKFISVWMALILAFARLESSHSACESHSFHVNDVVKDRAIDDRIFKTSVIQEFHSECFSKCVENCQCLSFNVCAGKQCQLNAGTKDTSPNSLKVKDGCSYYTLRRSQTTSLPGCCSVSNPCLNGGSCSAALPYSKRRFKCLCRTGYTGDLCQTSHNAKSCADFLQGKVKPLSGEYEIVDASETPYTVYCDFDSEPGYAWTMLVSFSRENGETVSQTGLLEDLPINENAPNWENYRLSLARMNTLRQHSSHWRATCGYEEFGVDYQDYIRLNLSVVDFSKYIYNVGTNACQTIEFMNVLGLSCQNCNFGVYHHVGIIPALAPTTSKEYNHCAFDMSHKQHICTDNSHARLFAVRSCVDVRFRCQKESSSTTQHWFGNHPVVSD